MGDIVRHAFGLASIIRCINCHDSRTFEGGCSCPIPRYDLPFKSTIRLVLLQSIWVYRMYPSLIRFCWSIPPEMPRPSSSCCLHAPIGSNLIPLPLPISISAQFNPPEYHLSCFTAGLDYFVPNHMRAKQRAHAASKSTRYFPQGGESRPSPSHA